MCLLYSQWLNVKHNCVLDSLEGKPYLKHNVLDVHEILQKEERNTKVTHKIRQFVVFNILAIILYFMYIIYLAGWCASQSEPILLVSVSILKKQIKQTHW